MSRMVPTTPTGVPAQLVAGDSWRWRIPDHAEYLQVDGWTLAYHLLGISTSAISSTWQTTGDDASHWLISVALADTASVEPGRYRLLGRMVGSGTYAGREHTVTDTIVEVLADPRQADPGDYQTHAERMVAVLEASVEGMVSDEQMIEQYGVAGRQVQKMPFAARASMLGRYRAQVRREVTGTIGRPVAATFTAPR